MKLGYPDSLSLFPTFPTPSQKGTILPFLSFGLKAVKRFCSDMKTKEQISDAECPYGSMRCEATFLEKAISKVSYVADRNINLVGLDWIDELNYIQFPDENKNCRTPILEPTNAENLVGGCNQSDIPCGVRFTFERVRCGPTLAKNKQLGHLYLQQNLFNSEALIVGPRHSAPAAEFRGQGLRTACKEMWLSKQLCVLAKCNRKSAYSEGDLVYARK
ncbi:hypothetical protein ACTXT7_007474 [Hymenolepis weldensis]